MFPKKFREPGTKTEARENTIPTAISSGGAERHNSLADQRNCNGIIR
jgi:hypothetical protein